MYVTNCIHNVYDSFTRYNQIEFCIYLMGGVLNFRFNLLSCTLQYNIIFLLKIICKLYVIKNYVLPKRSALFLFLFKEI